MENARLNQSIYFKISVCVCLCVCCPDHIYVLLQVCSYHIFLRNGGNFMYKNSSHISCQHLNQNSVNYETIMVLL